MRVLLTYLERVKRLKIWRRPRRRTLWLSALGIAMLFSAYLVVLYQQLNLAFQRREEFSPTRIYSDVVRLRLGQTKSSVEARLRDLNYSITSEGNKISFTLRQVAYPDYLLPDGHPTFMWQSKRVEMEFESDQPQAPLVAIGPGLQDIYLEPELVTTLARSGPSGENGKDQIRYALKFENIPAPVWQAIIAIEDQHFLDHKGLDPRGFARAIWINLKTLSFAQGGSTLTQQLVKNLMARRTKNLFKKINELFLALILEVRYDKEQILERYLNEVYLGQVGPYEIHGVGEGAKHFFGKSVQDLNLAETAMLAGLIRGPGFYSPYRHMDRAVGRQKLVLQKMVETEQIAPEEMEEALLQPIRLVPPTVLRILPTT